jgi:hypothetical protein
MPNNTNDMLELLLRDIDATEINAFARAIQTPADYLLSNLIFPERTLQGVKWKTKSTTRRVPAASFRAWDTQTKVATREIKRMETEGKLLPLGQKYIVGELETILLDTARGMDTDDIVQAIYDDIAAHVLAIRNRMELALGDMFVDGVFELDGENNLTLEADFHVPSVNMPAAPTAWTDPTADMLADEMRWMEVLRSSGAPMPEMVVTSYKAAALAASNNSYRAAYYGSVSPSATPTAVLAPNEVNVVRGRYGLPPVVTYDVTIPKDDGTDVRPLPENMWFMVPPNRQSWAEAQYGITAESLVLSSGGNPAILREEAPGIVITHGYSDDPVEVWTKGAAVAMPVMYVPDIHIAATVFPANA